MKEVTIHMVWNNSVTVEVDDDFTVPGTLNEFPEDVLEQMDTQGASLVAWS